jgi:hypothetical protein
MTDRVTTTVEHDTDIPTEEETTVTINSKGGRAKEEDTVVVNNDDLGGVEVDVIDE